MLRDGSLPYTDGRAIAGYPIALSGVEAASEDIADSARIMSSEFKRPKQ